eukprot:12108989-Alexandrium_andersonii.AAC.1
MPSLTPEQDSKPKRATSNVCVVALPRIIGITEAATLGVGGVHRKLICLPLLQEEARSRAPAAHLALNPQKQASVREVLSSGSPKACQLGIHKHK